MEILLNNDDLTFLDNLIKKTPFEYAQPLFQFFSGKIQEIHAANQAVEQAKINDEGNKGVIEAEAISDSYEAPKKRKSALAKV